MNLKNRLFSFLFYLGFTLLFPFRISKKFKEPDLDEHYSTALVVSLIVISCIFSALFIWILGITAFAKYSPRSLETLVFFNFFFLIYIVFFILLFGVFIWLIHIFNLLFGKNIRLSFISKLKKRPGILKFSYIFQASFILIILVVVFISFHSFQLSKKTTTPSKIYMLYDDMGFVPKWLLTLGFYQVQLAAQNKWGAGNVSIEPITHENLREALCNASLIFFSVHGDWSNGEYAGQFHFFNKTRDKMYLYGPDQIKHIGIGEKLKFVYLAHCNGGLLEKEWAETFYPAKIKSFNRISTYPEHIFWLWIKLPNIIKDEI